MKVSLISLAKAHILPKRKNEVEQLIHTASETLIGKSLILYTSTPSFDFQSISHEGKRVAKEMVSLLKDTAEKIAKKTNTPFVPLGRTIDMFDVKYKMYIPFWEYMDEIVSHYDSILVIIFDDIAVNLYRNIEQFRCRQLMPEIFLCWNMNTVLSIELHREIACIQYVPAIEKEAQSKVLLTDRVRESEIFVPVTQQRDAKPDVKKVRNAHKKEKNRPPRKKLKRKLQLEAA